MFIESGDKVEVIGPNIKYKMTVNDSISPGHKFAVADVNLGEKIIKYGEVIGEATLSIKRGSHVHIHNVQSVRIGR